MKRRMLIIVSLTLPLVALGAVVLPDSSEGTSGLSSISARAGTAQVAGLGRTATIVSTKHSRVFFRYEQGAGSCHGVGSLTQEGSIRPGVEACGTGFPSPSLPVLPFVSVESQKVGGVTTLRRFEGFAADGVAEVEMVRPRGSVVSRDAVASNTFKLSVSELVLGEGVILIARNEDGHEVYRHTFGPRQGG